MENTIIQKKICLFGDFSVGKTSLIRRFVYNQFEENNLNTIGVIISRKEVKLSENNSMQMMIWDLAGGDEFNSKPTSYIQGASGALLVCDLTREQTYPSLQEYFIRLKEFVPQSPVLLLGNKSDLVKSLQDSETKISEIAQKLGCQYFLTSAKTGANVEHAFQILTQQLLIKKT